MDHRLIDMLVCPVCKGPLEDRRHAETGAARPLPARELVCPADRLAFPVRDGIPVMLANEARALDGEGEPA
ncbi:Trm112 family protein [Roseateles sp. SL47]|jgi:uncharacterized protein|uniref:Trm112 family protein n=1 Tax=Roseateles sp. SL47 TaxID=2995138 RepID=UPI0022711B9C|nr:Trm112 family protein [Roseateles sp. SL47]WAC70768.1 Trm112 family protein [Roseateles sp. SL47]